jgi:hypothetical protein
MLKKEPWRAVNAHNGGGSKWIARGSSDPLTLTRSRFLISIRVKI